MLLNLKNLKTHYRMNGRAIKAVDGVNLSLEQGENLGLVGESGCGKTPLAKSINRILPANGGIVSGEINFQGRDLVQLSDKELNKLRWQEVAMVTQSAMNALNPVYSIGDQMVEAFQTHVDISRKQALEQSEELFSLVGLEASRLQDYPHQLSGGMKQRVVIAMAMALKPSLIIADEPTTALDGVVQDGILRQFIELQQKIDSSIILVTHDISVVAEICQRVAVMYAGHLMEQGTTREIFKQAYHPYTLGLINAFPTLEAAADELISIPGSPPDLGGELQGCRFRERCPFSQDKCERLPERIEVAPDHFIRCHFPDRVEEFRERARLPETWFGDDVEVIQEKKAAKSQNKKVLEVEGARKVFQLSAKGIIFKQKRNLKAVDGVSFTIKDREILGLAGESGSGKSTLGELIARLQDITEGKIVYLGQNISELDKKQLKKFRSNLQMVFQDPYETLNPRFTVLQTIMEPLKIHEIGSNFFERVERVKQALDRAELRPPEDFLDRFPHQLSGGQRQRVALARAIVLEPDFIVADEPVSMLDVSVRAGILNLLKNLRDEMGASILYISHDLATIRYICDRTAILYLGRVMEIGETEEVISSPCHPYTRMLLKAVPIPDPDRGRERVDPRGEIPDPIDLPNGCRFHPRCELAPPDCGFEGRDVKKIIVREQTRPDYLNISPELEIISEMEVKGRNIILKLEESSASEKEKMEERLKVILNDWNSSLIKAAESWQWQDSSLKIEFSEKPEPELRPGPEGQQVACVLY